MKTQAADLIISSSETDANLYYLTRFLAPDPFIFIQIHEEKILVMSDLEIDRAKKQARVDTILSYHFYEKKARTNGIENPGTIDVLHQFLSEREIKHLKIPSYFGIRYALLLEERGYNIEVKNDPFVEDRLRKKDDEVVFITETLRYSENAIDKAIEYIKNTEIIDGYLYSHGSKVTCEDIRKLMSIYLLENNYLALHTIVSCGEDTSFPHEEGSGPLMAGTPIIIDLFPRSIGNRYYADITRTVVKGKASQEIKEMYRAVMSAQEKAIYLIKEGVNGQDIHESVLQYFKSQGYDSGEIAGRLQGFFHGTGHGVGLDIHEAPRISKKSEVLSEGNVVTIEPGLYYEGIGGVRLEDMVVVEKNGARNLTKSPKILEV